MKGMRANRRVDRLSVTLPDDPCRVLGGKIKRKKQTRRLPFDLKVRRKRRRIISYKQAKIREFISEGNATCIKNGHIKL